MPLTLSEIQSLISALGVKIPADILAQRVKAEEFKVRREKIATEGAGKPGDWWLKPKFDDTLKRADESAGKKQYDPALTLLEEAGQVLQQPDTSPEVLAALQQLTERKSALETDIARVQGFDSPIGVELKTGLDAVAQALQGRDAGVAEKRLGELEAMHKSFEQQKAASEAERVKAGEFVARWEKVNAEAGGKAADWSLKAKFDELLKGATETADKKQFDSAFQLLDEAAELLKQPDLVPSAPVEKSPEPASEPKLPTEAEAAPVASLAAIWQQAKERVNQQVSQLQGALRMTMDPRCMRIAEMGLNGVTGKLQVGLQVALMELDQAGGRDRKLGAKAIRIIEKFQKFVGTDKVIGLCDGNPFGVKCDISGTLLPAFAELERRLDV